MHYSLSTNPLKIGLCRETLLFRDQYVFNQGEWVPALLMGKRLHQGEPWASWFSPRALLAPHLCHSVKQVSSVSWLIDSLQKWKLILGRSNVKPLEEELNISEEKMGGKAATAILDFLKILVEEQKIESSVCSTMDRSSLP